MFRRDQQIYTKQENNSKYSQKHEFEGISLKTGSKTAYFMPPRAFRFQPTTYSTSNTLSISFCPYIIGNKPYYL